MADDLYSVDNQTAAPTPAPATAPATTPDYTAQLQGLYHQYLNRDADQGGLDYFTNNLKSGQTLEDVANSIKASDEYKGLQNTNAIQNLYHQYLGRDADQEGLNYWTNSLKNGQSLDQIASSFTKSDEFNQLNPQAKDIEGLYNQYLERGSDAGGMQYYLNELKNGKTLDDVTKQISGSPENRFQDTIAEALGDNKLTLNEAYQVKQLADQFGLSPEEAGKFDKVGNVLGAYDKGIGAIVGKAYDPATNDVQRLAIDQGLMDKYGLTAADIAKYSNGIVDEKGVQDFLNNMNNRTVSDYEGHTYKWNDLNNLYKQIMPNFDWQHSGGGFYGEKGGGAGISNEDLARLTGIEADKLDPRMKIGYDMANYLMQHGITDISQLKPEEIRSTVQVMRDADGNYTAYDPNSTGYSGEGSYSQQAYRSLTPEEAAKVRAVQSYGGGDSDPGNQYYLDDVLTGYKNKLGQSNLSWDSGTANPLNSLFGATYTGPGHTNYWVDVDPKTGQPKFYTRGESSSDMGDIGGILAIASLIPGVAPFAQLANAAIAAHNGNILGAVTGALGVTGIPGLDGSIASNLGIPGEAMNALKLGNAVANKDILGALGQGASLGGMDLNSLKAGDIPIMQGIGLAQALSSGNYGALLGLAGDQLNIPDLKTAGDVTRMMQAAASGNAGAMVNAAQRVGNTITKADGGLLGNDPNGTVPPYFEGVGSLLN